MFLPLKIDRDKKPVRLLFFPFTVKCQSICSLEPWSNDTWQSTIISPITLMTIWWPNGAKTIRRDRRLELASSLRLYYHHLPVERWFSFLSFNLMWKCDVNSLVFWDCRCPEFHYRRYCPCISSTTISNILRTQTLMEYALPLLIKAFYVLQRMVYHWLTNCGHFLDMTSCTVVLEWFSVECGK